MMPTREEMRAAREHHLKDIRAELKAKTRPNYLPGTALVNQTSLTAHSGMGLGVCWLLFPKESARGEPREGWGSFSQERGCFCGWS